MKLIKNGNYIDTQEDGKEVVRYNLRNGRHVQDLQEKTKAGMELAIINPKKIINSNTIEILTN